MYAYIEQAFRIYVHRHFNASSLRNDIAIIRLATEAVLNDYVQPICLWDSNKKDVTEVVGKYGTIVGFGVTEKDEPSIKLRQAVVPVVSLTTCLESNPPFFGNYLSDYTLCAGFRNGWFTPCG